MRARALQNRPLLDTSRDRPLFVGRHHELDQLIENIERGWNTLLLGQGGTGKTSLLNRLEGELEERAQPVGNNRRILPVRLPPRLSDPVDFLTGLVTALEDALEGADANPPSSKSWAAARDAGQRLKAERGAGLTSSLLHALRVIGDAVGSLDERGSDVVFIVDELATPEVAWTIFGQLRDELWTLGGTWVVAGRQSDLATLLRPPADTFFERQMVLGDLTTEDAAEFVRTRLLAEHVPPYPSEDLQRIIGLANGNPLILLQMLRHLESGGDLDGLDVRTPELREVSAPARRLMNILTHHSAPVSAINDSLLAETGWSPARLRQLFGELEQAELVHAETAPASGPGRPRRQYWLDTSVLAGAAAQAFAS